MVVISLAHFDRSSTSKRAKQTEGRDSRESSPASQADRREGFKGILASEPSRQKGGIQGNPRQRERHTQQTDQISPSLELRRNLLSEYLATSIQRRIRETDPQVRTMVIMYVMYVSVWLILVKNCAKCCMVFEH